MVNKTEALNHMGAGREEELIKLCSGTKGWGSLSPVVVSAAIVSLSMFTGVNWKGLSGDDSY